MKSIIVYGPQGCGKTTHAEQLRQHFGLTAVQDDWTTRDRLPLRDTLVLTNEAPESAGLDVLGLQLMPYAEAIAAMGASR